MDGGGAYAAAVVVEPSPIVPGPQLAAGPSTMLELGAALGADVWWLEQLFAVAGAWVPTTEEATVRAHLAELSRVAGDHAVALRAHLPRPAPVDPDGWVRPPAPEAEVLVAEWRDLCAGAPARLATLHRVLVARLVVAWAAPTGPSARGAARAVGHARTDLAAVRDEGEALLHALMAADRSAVGAAATAVAEVEQRVAGLGGLRPLGPPQLPG